MELLCRILHVSESGYYRYLKNLSKPSKDALLSAAIDRIMNESDYNDNYGVERMQLALEQNGFHTGKRRIRRIMHEKGYSVEFCVSDIRQMSRMVQFSAHVLA